MNYRMSGGYCPDFRFGNLSWLQAPSYKLRKMKDFKKLMIWQKGMVLASEIYKASKFFPKEELFGLRSQTTRAAVET